MLNRLVVERFKRFASLDVELAPLTVLTGLNSAGKSTTLQALLLLRTALRSATDFVPLHGADGLGLGEPFEILHLGSSDETIVVASAEDGNDDLNRVTLEMPSDERALYLRRREGSLLHPTPSLVAADEPAFTYLCAERHGPRDTLGAASHEIDRIGVGVFGERTAQVLSLWERREVPEARIAPAKTKDEQIAALRFLGRQTERWLARIVGLEDAPRIDARWIEGTSVTTLRFQMSGHQSAWVRPHNVGFGVSYVLPIVVAGLQAPERGGMLLVENPEAHLHPAGQSAMGAFLAQIAASGVQVIIETHSDHVINGIRRAAAEQSTTLPSGDVAILYFRATVDGSSGALPYERIALRETGELSVWPKGFFDQIQLDLGAVAQARLARRKR